MNESNEIVGQSVDFGLVRHRYTRQRLPRVSSSRCESSCVAWVVARMTQNDVAPIGTGASRILRFVQPRGIQFYEMKGTPEITTCGGRMAH